MPAKKRASKKERSPLDGAQPGDFAVAILSEVDVRIAKRFQEADANAARRVGELKFELSRQKRPRAVSFRVAHYLLDLLEEALEAKR